MAVKPDVLKKIKDMRGLASAPQGYASGPYSTVSTAVAEPMSQAWGNAVPQAYGFKSVAGVPKNTMVTNSAPLQGLQGSSYYYTNPETNMTSSVDLTPEQLDAIQNPYAPEGSSWLNADNMKMGAQGLQALSGLANAYMGYKNYGLAKDQFNFEKALANANYVNAAKAYNTDLTNAANVGLALGGGAMTPEQIAASRAYTQGRTVSERPIG